MKMRYYRRTLRISFKKHVIDEEVRGKIQQAIGPHKDLLTILTRLKLQWYGQVSRSSGPAKTIIIERWAGLKSRVLHSSTSCYPESCVSDFCNIQFHLKLICQTTEVMCRG